MTKSIILAALVFLGACASGIEDEGDPGEIAPAAATSPGETAAEVPTTKGSDFFEPVKGDPSLRRDDNATTFVPLLSWSFESASADCNGWPVLGAKSSIRAVPSRSGSYSCKVCADGTSADLAVGREIGKVTKGQYVLSAFVRSRANTAAPGEAVARVEATDADGNVTIATAAAVAVRGEWDRVQALVDLPADATSVKIAVGSPHAAKQTCLFVDDVTFSQAP